MPTSSTIKTWIRSFILAGIFCIIVVFLMSISNILTPFVFSLVVSYLLNPLVERIQKKTLTPRWLISIITTLIIVGLIGLFLFLSIPFLAKQILLILQSCKTETITSMSDKLHVIIQKFIPSGNEDLLSFISQNISDLAEKATKKILQIINTTTISLIQNLGDSLMFLLTPLVLYYTIKDWNKIIKSAKSLIPRQYQKGVLATIHDIDMYVSRYIKGQLKASLILCFIYPTLLYFSPLKSGFLLGIAVGICTTIPYIGFLFMTAIISLISFQKFGGDLSKIGMTLSLLFIGQLIDMLIITPKMMQKSLKLSPVWIIFGVLSCSHLFGTIGAFFSMPIIVVIMSITRPLLRQYKNSAIYRTVR